MVKPSVKIPESDIRDAMLTTLAYTYDDKLPAYDNFKKAILTGNTDHLSEYSKISYKALRRRGMLHARFVYNKKMNNFWLWLAGGGTLAHYLKAHGLVVKEDKVSLSIPMRKLEWTKELLNEYLIKLIRELEQEFSLEGIKIKPNVSKLSKSLLDFSSATLKN